MYISAHISYNGKSAEIDFPVSDDLLNDILTESKMPTDTTLPFFVEDIPANEYEVAAFTGRGEKFLHHSDVHLQSMSSFTIYPPVVSLQNVLDKLI